MPRLSIRQYPDPVLRVPCAPVDAFDAELERLVADMVETMHGAPGIGLAAPQVGVERRVALVDLSVGREAEALHVLVNPEIQHREGKEVELEGCLSLPDFSDKVTRPAVIEVHFQGIDGEPRELRADGWLARAICHEVDHLDGVLFVDHLKGLRRERARRYLRRLVKEQEASEWTPRSAAEG